MEAASITKNFIPPLAVEESHEYGSVAGAAALSSSVFHLDVRRAGWDADFVSDDTATFDTQLSAVSALPSDTLYSSFLLPFSCTFSSRGA